jgi:hypothetical protein
MTTRLAAIELRCDDASMTSSITLSGPAIWEGRLRCRISRGMLNRLKAWQVVTGLSNSMASQMTIQISGLAGRHFQRQFGTALNKNG